MTLIVKIDNMVKNNTEKMKKVSIGSMKISIKLINLFSLTKKMGGEQISLSEMKKWTPLRC